MMPLFRCSGTHSCDSAEGRRFHMWDAIKAYIPSFLMSEANFPAQLDVNTLLCICFVSLGLLCLL